MATSNLVLRKLEEQRQQDLASLELLSRDLESYLRGAKEVKVKDAPKYVTGVTKSQGDEEYASNIRAFGSKQLVRAFGMNMGMSAIQQQVLNELEGKYGSGSGTREFVDLATQVICHLLIQSATHMKSANGKDGLPYILKTALDELKSTNSLVSMLAKLNGIPATKSSPANAIIAGKVYKWLRPLNLTHIERVDARYAPRIRSRDSMLLYIANAEAQTAVNRYMVDHALPDDVLAPAAVETPASSDDDALIEAATNSFDKYPSKDVAATYAYYSKAVKENLDFGLGLQTGDVKAALDSAAASLREAANALRTSGVPARVSKVFKSGFEEAASSLSRINPSSNEADEDIAFIVADLCDLLGAYDGVGTNSAKLKTGKLANAGLAAGTTYGDRVALVLGSAPSKYVTSTGSSFIDKDLEFLDAQDEICPNDVEAWERGNPRFRDVRNALGTAFINLKDAHGLLVPMFRVADRPQGVASLTVGVTQEFADLVCTALTKVQARIETAAKATPSVNMNLLKPAIFEAYEQLLGATKFGAGGSLINNLTTDCAFSNIEDPSTSSWGIPARRLNDIASGTAPTLNSPGVEEAILDAFNRAARAGTYTATQRRATRDFALMSAKMISDTMQTMRAQAENTNIQVQTRRNPAMSKGHMALTGAGALVGTHAVSAAVNRFVQPASGSMNAHLADYAPSLAVAGYGAYKAHQGDKDLGYSLLGGAVAHMGLRYLFTCCPSLRFSENPFLKALQAPTNGLAHLIGDESMAASALTPASIEGKGDTGEYVLSVVNANDCPSLCYIAVQLRNSGLSGVSGTAKGVSALEFSVTDAEINPRSCAVLARALVSLKCLLKQKGMEAVASGRVGLDFSKVAGLAEVLASQECINAIAATTENMSKILNVPAEELAPVGNALNGFILEPGYNMNVYSGEDQVSYLQPAPHATSQPGIVQLDNAIARARKLGPRELLQEGIEDLVDVSIIVVPPRVARDCERMGRGTSLGKSRTNPGHEVVALEVEGANGIWPIAPERQQSVPQGALNYAKIGPAADITVSSEGLFNRGIFSPRYGR